MDADALAARLGVASAEGLVGALLESLGDALYVVDGDGTVLYANRVALDLLGFEDERDLLGRPSHATIHYKHPDGRPFPAEQCPLLRPHRTGEAVHVEEDWFVRRDGSMVPVAYSSAPVAVAGSRGAVVVFRDLTARLEAERLERTRELERGRAEELRASRARIVTATDAERRRLARDLHDGAQQRLVNVALSLDVALHGADLDPALRAGLDGARAEVRAAVEDLRRFARGLHPSILEHRGLQAALASLTASAPVPVDLDVPGERYPPAVEAAAYFFAAEALANAFKHAQAAAVAVRVVHADGRLTVEVSDDGVGGAVETAAGGLAGLADRIAALEGHMTISGGPGAGTRVRAVLPASPSAPAGP